MPVKILVADDEPNILQLVEVCFEGLDAELTVAKDGGEAWESICRERPDVAVLDVMMPRIDGYQLCRMIRTDPALHALPVILLSAKSAPSEIQAGLDAGANDFLPKPFSPREFVKKVFGAVEGRTEQK